ncbi:MAG: hypothetical protein FJZ58_06080 [Chlamydiae bacterium]|nr:hypothetical protein [Chlamydiota bacterium]
MFKQVHILCALSLGTFSNFVVADQAEVTSDLELSMSQGEEPAFLPSQETTAPEVPLVEQAALPTAEEPALATKKPRIKEVFSPFTGKVKGKKVRLRLQPDTEGAIVKELTRGDLLSVVDDAGDFWTVETPSDVKAYVFRSFVLDGVIEGSKVNVRLQPNLEAPIATHLTSGDPVPEGVICASNNKWIEFSMPSHTRFYVCKDFVENIGSPDLKIQYENRLASARQQLETAHYFVDNEMQKDYSNIDFDKMSHSYQVVIQEYSEFPDLVEQARESLARMQEKFLDKRVAYLEHQNQEEQVVSALSKEVLSQGPATEKMKAWEPVEEALYLAWFSSHDGKNMDEYYEDQKLTATRVVGTLEPYTAPVKCKPGNYIVRHQDLPVAYVYSTTVNLENFVGKQVTLVGSPRPNNNFAFPAYFVFTIEP